MNGGFMRYMVVSFGMIVSEHRTLDAAIRRAGRVSRLVTEAPRRATTWRPVTEVVCGTSGVVVGEW